jgi:hypothetical protein
MNKRPEKLSYSGIIHTAEVKCSVKKIALALLLAVCMAPAATTAEVGVVVRVALPAPMVEHYRPPPQPGWVWIAGYHRWDGARYVWVPGYWTAPPHPHAVWVPHHWVHRHGGWVLIEGHWR